MTLRTLLPALVVVVLLVGLLAYERGSGAAPAAASDAPRSRPTRILPCNAGAVDYLVSLVEPARVIGLPHTAHGFATLDGPHAGWDELPAVEDFSSEAILRLGPDLVMTHAWQDQAAMKTVDAAGIRVLRLPEAKGYDELRALLLDLGRTLDVDARAAELVADYDERVARLRARRPSRRLRALSYSNFGTGGWTAGADTTFDWMVELAGLENAAATAGLEGHVGIDLEQLLVIDPDVLVLGVAVADPGRSPTLEYLENEPALAELRVVSERAFAILPSHLALADSHRLIDGAEALVRAVDELENR